MQIPALALIKISCMLFYQRIFQTGSRSVLYITIYAMVSLIAIWGIGFFFATTFECGGSTFWYLWGAVEDLMLCPVNITQVDQALAITDFILDIFVLVFPIPLV